MNKLTIVGILVIGFFIFPSVTEENVSTEGRLEIISPSECVSSKKQIDNCSKLLNINLNNNCFVEEEFRFEFSSNTHIEFLTIQSNIDELQILKVEIDNIKTEHFFENNLFWLDINKNVNKLKINFENVCEIISLDFYGRIKE